MWYLTRINSCVGKVRAYVQSHSRPWMLSRMIIALVDDEESLQLNAEFVPMLHRPMRSKIPSMWLVCLLVFFHSTIWSMLIVIPMLIPIPFLLIVSLILYCNSNSMITIVTYITNKICMERQSKTKFVFSTWVADLLPLLCNRYERWQEYSCHYRFWSVVPTAAVGESVSVFLVLLLFYLSTRPEFSLLPIFLGRRMNCGIRLNAYQCLPNFTVVNLVIIIP